MHSWESLAFQPAFTAAGSNVAFGFWSNDISGGPKSDKPLALRWIQWGTVSPVFRVHGGNFGNDIWLMPEPWRSQAVSAVRWRECHLPYIYSLYRETFDTGLGPVRGMHIDFPESDNAYAYTQQFMLGDDLIVSPITVSGEDVAWPVWLPAGRCVEIDSLEVIDVTETEGRDDNRTWGYSQIPRYCRAGCLLPSTQLPQSGSELIGFAAQSYAQLTFTAYPGADAGSAAVYEDDGSTTAYAQRVDFAWTIANYTRSGDRLSFELGTSGTYLGLPQLRDYAFVFLATGGAKLAHASGTATTPVVSQHDGKLIIEVLKQPVTSPLIVDLDLESDIVTIV